jgi:hypothetical protein
MFTQLFNALSNSSAFVAQNPSKPSKAEANFSYRIFGNKLVGGILLRMKHVLIGNRLKCFYDKAKRKKTHAKHGSLPSWISLKVSLSRPAYIPLLLKIMNIIGNLYLQISKINFFLQLHK